LEGLFRFLRFYSAAPQKRLHIFNASSREELDILLAQENEGLITNSVSAGQFLRERRISSGGSQQEDAAESMSAPRRANTDTLAPLPQPRVPEPIRQEQSVTALERRRFELEMGAGGDHDQPYIFTLPVSIPQFRAWTRLMGQVQQGEIRL
jgi:hypothetical protein